MADFVRLKVVVEFEYEAKVSDYMEAGLFDCDPSPAQMAALDETDLKDGDLLIYDLADDFTITVTPA